MATRHSSSLVDPEPATPITHSNVIFTTVTVSCCHPHFYLFIISQDRLRDAAVTNTPQISAPRERSTFLSCAAWPSRAGCAPAARHPPSRTPAEGQRKHNMAN